MYSYGHHISDYAMATEHLSWDQDMAYTRLLRVYYRTERPIPLDLEVACRMVRAIKAYERKAIVTVLQMFFFESSDGWHNKRCDEEIAKYHSRINKSKHAAALRWQSSRDADASAEHSERNGNHNHNHNQEDLTHLSGTPDASAIKGNGNGHTRDAVDILDFLNEKTGKHFQPVPGNLKLITARLREGATADECRAVIVRRVREWANDERMKRYLRPKTLFNSENFANYRGEVGDG